MFLNATNNLQYVRSTGDKPDFVWQQAADKEKLSVNVKLLTDA